MTQFGQLLPIIADGYTRVPATDRTGLSDGYDFTLNFSTVGEAQAPPPEAGTARSGVAVDPTGTLSLPDAVRRQLGIKLEETTRLMPAIVIDSISQTPTDN